MTMEPTEGRKVMTARKLKALAKMMSTPDLIQACRANDRHTVPTGLSRAQYSEAVDRLERYAGALRTVRAMIVGLDDLDPVHIEGVEDE